jgi:flagellar basal body-associated protein FliL
VSDNTNSKGSNGLKIAIVVGIVVIAALLGVIIFLLVGNREEPEKRNVVLNKDNAEEVIEDMVKNAEEETLPITYYETTMTTEWHFKNGKATSEDAYVANSTSNSTDVYFDIVLSNDEENVIYKSPIIPRGGELDKIALDKVLDKGDYDCVCIYHLVDENQKTLSTLRVTLKISIEN